MNETPIEPQGPRTAGGFPDSLKCGDSVLSSDSGNKGSRPALELDPYRRYWASIYPGVVIETTEGPKR